MANDEFTLKLDLSEVMREHKDIAQQIQERLEVAARQLAIQTHAHVKEEAASKLKTRLPMFSDNLDFEQVDKNTWAIIVRAPGRWIEDGMEPHSMLDDLLASPKAKSAKDGSKYIAVPFKHSKGPTQQTPHQRAITTELKKELRALKVPYGKVERNPDGSPKEGLLHSLDFRPKQKKPQGQGPAGFPMSAHHTGTGVEGPEGRPFLFGVRIYQKIKRNPDGSPRTGKSGNVLASREIFTFRMASSKQAGNKWFHPGLPPQNFLDEAYDWAKQLWDDKIAPEVMTGLVR